MLLSVPAFRPSLVTSTGVSSAWMTCRMPKTDICMYHNINWRTVGNCFDAAHKRHEPDVSARIHDNVVRICVDETSYKKGHKYITVVYDMDKNKVIWIHEGYGKEVFEEFCTQLSEEERSRIEIVAGDGAKWIDSCTKKYFPNAIRCIDFFHVVQWVNNSLDDVRINTSRKATREYNKIKDNFIKAEAEEAEAFAMPKKNMKRQSLNYVQCQVAEGAVRGIRNYSRLC